MANIPDFHVHTTVTFNGVITQNGANPDITSDTVRVILKSKKSDADAAAVINELADVATNGADGRFDVSWAPTKTDITPASYHMEITWTTSGGAVPWVHEQVITALERVLDVP